MADMMMGKTDMRPQGGNRPRDGRHCDLCGCSQPAVRCDKCGCQIFCLSCDDMYHRHPKRRFHLRKAVDPGPPTALARPVLPVKAAHSSPGDPSKMPLPPPRKKKPAGKSFFDTFRRRSPSAEHSPPLPKKEYSWTDRLGNIKKFMSNRPLPPLPDTNGHDDSGEFQQQTPPTKHDMSFIHKRVEEKPPQLPQRSLKPENYAKEKQMDRPAINNVTNGRNGTLNPSMMNRRFSGEEENWENRMSGHPQQITLNRQAPQGYFPPGGPGFPGHMHQSSSATDLQNLEGYPGMPPHYPHYPMPFPYPPMYPPQAYPPQYFGSSFANLSSHPATTTDDDQSEDASSRGKRFAFRKRAKRSQSVMMDRMAYPGQFFPFGPYPPGYGPGGPWGGAPFPTDAPPSPASSVRSLSRLGRTRRRKKAAATSDDDDEPSLSSSPLSRPKSSSSERPPPQRRPPPPSSSEEESEEEERSGSRSEKTTRKGSDPPKQPVRKTSDPKRMPSSPVPKSPLLQNKKFSKHKMKEIAKQSDSEEIPISPTKLERQPSRESNTDQAELSAPFTPSGQWQCLHCTFINGGGSRICQVCCKTATADSAALVGGSRPQSEEPPAPSPEKRAEERNQDMAVLNSALDEAEEEINRGLQELMKLKEDFLPSSKPDSSPVRSTEPPKQQDDSSSRPKPVYKSSGKMRSSILDKLNLQSNKTTSSIKTTTTASTSTETTQGGGPSKLDRVIEARRPSTSSTTSDVYNSPTAQSPLPSSKRESSCQTQTDDLMMGFMERKKAEEESYFRRGSNGYDRRDGMQSPRRDGMQSPVFDRGYGGGGFGGMMHRSHSRASLFTGRMNDLGPLDYGLGPTPMYRSVSRSSLTGDYTDNRFSEFHNLRKPDYYLSMEELVERRRQESIRAQGLELVRMIREAEQQGFSADDIQVALSNCGPQNPLEWLQENWRGLVEGVVGLSASYARDKKEDDVGTVSDAEAREALRLHKGHVWAAVTECVESRQRKFLELKARGKFKNKDITDALSGSLGDVEAAYAKLTKSSGKPFLMRIWGAGEGVANQDPAPISSSSDAYGRHQYVKDDDVLSDEAWEDEEVDWEEEDSEDDEEQGDLEDLRTCHEDLGDIKTPESDSEYADAFGSNTLERNVASPGSDVFDVIPEVKQEKRGGGFLSKLAALRKDDKGKKQATFYGSDVDVSSLDFDVREEEDGATKGGGPLSVIRNTLSAIRESVSGVKGERKSSTLEKRTIVVKGQIASETLSGEKGSAGVTLVSAKPLKNEEELFLSEETKKKEDGVKDSRVQVAGKGAEGKTSTSESKNVDAVTDVRRTEALTAVASTSGYVPPNKKQDKPGSVENSIAVDKPVEKKSEEKLVSLENNVSSSGNKTDSKGVIHPATSNSSLQKNSDAIKIRTDGVKSSSVSPQPEKNVYYDLVKDDTKKVKFQISDEKINKSESISDSKPSKTSNSQNVTANARTLKDSETTERTETSKSIEVSKKETDKPSDSVKPSDKLEAVRNHEDNLSTSPRLESGLDFQTMKSRTPENTRFTSSEIRPEEFESKERVFSTGEKQTLSDQSFQNSRKIDVKEDNRVQETTEESHELDNPVFGKTVRDNAESFVEFPPVTSAIKAVDTVQTLKQNATNNISSQQMKDVVIPDDSDNAKASSKEVMGDSSALSAFEISTNENVSSEATSAVTAEEHVIDSKSINHHSTTKAEMKEEVPQPQASTSANTAANEKPKTSSEKKSTTIKPKFKLVKLSKNEPEDKKSQPSTSKASNSPKLDLDEQAKVQSASSVKISEASSTSPTTDKEIYPPDVIEKIKLIPISSSSRQPTRKTDSPSSQSPKSDLTPISSLETSNLETKSSETVPKTESKDDSILETQQSDLSRPPESKESLQINLKDIKMQVKSEKPIPDISSITETASSSSEQTLVERAFVTSESLKEHQSTPNTSSDQQVASSALTDQKPSSLEATPEPVPQPDRTTTPEPAKSPAATSLPEPVQIAATPSAEPAATLSSEPVQIPTTTTGVAEPVANSSPEPAKIPTAIGVPEPAEDSSSEPVQQSTVGASFETITPVTESAEQGESSTTTPTEKVHPSTTTASPIEVQQTTSTDSTESIQPSQSTSAGTTDTSEQHSKQEKDENQVKEGEAGKSSDPIPNTPEEPSTENPSEDDDESSDDSRGNSLSPPNPIDTLRNRFEGRMDSNTSGTVRPQSPFRRMSFRSTKAIIALERTRDSSAEKPWFLPKPPAPEIKKAVPKRSIKQQLEVDRKVRKMVSDRKCRTYRKAEMVVQLMEMNFEEAEALQAADDCSTLEQAISYLQQECLLCTGNFPVSHIISMVHCPHKACRECLRAYFTVQIRDRNIMELLCPFCNEPDIFDEDVAQDYFNHLDIMLKKLIDPEIHELFQRKLRDRVLMRDPNFKWCSQCSSGFLVMPNLKRLVCPDCNAVTCASCRRPWEREHQGISCEAFAAWKDAGDPEAQTLSLAKLLTEEGIDCPRCHFRYQLAKGGCMHFRCTQCQHDFCSGCSKPFKMGQKCGVSEFCGKLGLHAHHPRNCLFYLRDKEPEDLQRLLNLSGVKYDKEPSDAQQDGKTTCQVLEQKETADGMLDDCCGKEVEQGFAGLCRLHYVEYLGQLVNKHRVDPIQIFEKDDLELVLRRANIRLPPKRYRETDDQYKEKLIKLIQEELPLDRVEGS